jgi:hypothetical protein
MDEAEKIIPIEARVKSAIPPIKIFFLPKISPILPKGTRKIADARRYALLPQLNSIASRENSLAIAGNAIFTADKSNGVKKPQNTAIMRVLREMPGNFMKE